MIPPMLALDHRPPAPPLVLARDIALARGRAHEVAGPSRRLFAFLAAAALKGNVLWLAPRWWPERLAGDGLRPLFDPGRLVIGRGRGTIDLLWCAEEALRSGSVSLVVADLPEPPGLTPVRRLHLAAEAGAGKASTGEAGTGEAGTSEAGAAPLCLLLTPEEGGAAGVETRWHLAPLPGWAVDGRARWRLSRLRARTEPAASWEMRIEKARPVLSRERAPDAIAEFRDAAEPLGDAVVREGVCFS